MNFSPLLSLLILLTPTLLRAQRAFPNPTDERTFADIIRIFLDLIWVTLPVLIGLALLTFLWGLVKFIYKAGSDQDIKEGKQLVVWGLIALFVLASFTGIIAFLQRDVFGDNLGFPYLPQ